MGKKLKTDHRPKKEKLNLLSPLNSGLSGPKIELYSNKEAAIDGCSGVIDYYDYLIKLKITGGTVAISGTDLCLTELGNNSALISGNFNTIEFSMR